MRNLKTLALATIFALSATAAFAHPHPKSASPKPDVILKASPAEIRIGFSEGLEPAFSGIDLKNAAGDKIDEGKASLDPADNKQLVLALPHALAAGAYVVTWHVVGDDTHHMSGHYAFKVQP